MPRANQVRIHHHDQNDGFVGELDALGTASAVAHTHGERDGGAGVLAARTFSSTAKVFGPLQPGEWEAVITLSTTPGNAMSGIVKFCQTAVASSALAAHDAFVPGSTSGALGVLRLPFSVIPGKQFISFVSSGVNTMKVTLRRLKTR